MSRPAARRLAVAGVAAGCIAAAALPALAEPTVVQGTADTDVSVTMAGAGTRQLEVLDLAGNDIGASTTPFSLRPGVPTPFRVRVTDSGVGQLTEPRAGFQVNASLNNLYFGGDPTSTAMVPSSDVWISFPSGGTTTAAGTISAIPRTVLNGSVAGCNTLMSLLSLDPLSGIGLDLCDAVGGLGGTGLALAPVEVLTASAQTVTNVPQLPFALTGQQSGNFATADYENGVGKAGKAPDGATGTGRGTLRGLLSAAPSEAAAPAALAQLESLAQGAASVVSADGTGAQVSAPDVLAAMLALCPPDVTCTSAQTATVTLAEAMSALSASEIVSVLTSANNLTGDVSPVLLSDTQSVTGSYNSVPVITAKPSAPVQVAGAYTGTMTITLVNQ